MKAGTAKVEVSAHGYTLSVLFERDADGRAVMVLEAPFNEQPVTEQVDLSRYIREAEAWVASHRYDPASRAAAHRVGYLWLHGRWRDKVIEFNRSSEVLEANPVNDLIDQFAERLPILGAEQADPANG